jgi:hypothetical protein
VALQRVIQRAEALEAERIGRIALGRRRGLRAASGRGWSAGRGQANGNRAHEYEEDSCEDSGASSARACCHHYSFSGLAELAEAQHSRVKADGCQDLRYSSHV